MSFSIQFDRAIAKGHSGKMAFIAIAVLVIVPVAIWAMGWIGQIIFAHYHSSGSLDKGLLLDTLEVYLDPSNKPHDVGFSKRLYFLFVGTAGVFLLNGLLVSLLVSWFEKRRDRWEKGDLHYGRRALGNCAVVIGGNEMVPDLVGQLLERGLQIPLNKGGLQIPLNKERGLQIPLNKGRRRLDYVLVMTDSDVPALRKRLVSKLGADESRVVIYYGEQTSEDDLKNLKLQYTKYDIYIIGEQLDIGQSGSNHDVKNMECVQKIAGLLQESHIRSIIRRGFQIPLSRKTCRVMFEYQSTFSVFQFADVCTKISDVLDFRPFNYYEMWAQKVLVCKEIDISRRLQIPSNGLSYLPLEGIEPLAAESEDSVHFIVAGMSRMGVALAIEAAHLAHYPNFITKGKQTRITFIDPMARKEMDYLQSHYRELFAVSRWRYINAENDDSSGKLLDETEWHDARRDDAESPYRDCNGYSLGEKIVDVEWQFIQGRLETPVLQAFVRREAMKKDCRLTIAICFTHDNASLASSLYLPDEVYETTSNVVQVLVYQPNGDAMRRSFMDDSTDLNKSYKLFSKLRAFGMMNNCYSVADLDSMSIVSDAINAEYGKASQGQIPGRNQLRKRLGMETIKAGKSLAAKQWSSSYSASHIWTKLRSVGYDGTGEAFSEKDKAVLSAVEHVRWNMEQLLLGFAPLKNHEQLELLRRRKEAQKVPVPLNELMALSASKEDHVSKDGYQKVIVWLNAWKDYDDMKERLKADMSHADICSLDVLERVDKEAVEYDEVLVSILPGLYNQIKEEENGKQ